MKHQIKEKLTTFFNKFDKKIKVLSIFLVCSILVFIILSSYLLYIINRSNKEIMEVSEKSIHLANDWLINIKNDTDELIKQNSYFFKNYSDLENSDELVSVMKRVGDIKGNIPFIEEIVLFNQKSELLITSGGTISKTDFFGYNDKVNIEFWEEIIRSYNTPSSIPLSESSIKNEYLNDLNKRMFVVPQTYPFYKMGVLIFVNENTFLEYANISSDTISAKISIYDSEGKIVASNYNSKKVFKVEKFDGHNRIINKNIFGNFYSAKWFTDNYLIFEFQKFSPLVLWFYVFYWLIVGLACVFYIKLKAPEVECDFDSLEFKHNLLVRSLVDKSFYIKNKEKIDKSIGAKFNSFILLGSVFLNVKDESSLPTVEEFQKQLGEGVSVILKQNNIIISLINFHENDKEYLNNIELMIKEKFMLDTLFVKSNTFKDLSDISQNYIKLKNMFGLCSAKGDMKDIVVPNIPKNFRSIVSKYISEKSVKELQSYLDKIITDNIEQQISFDSLYYLISHLYFEMVSILNCGGNNAFSQNTYEDFFIQLNQFRALMDYNKMKKLLVSISLSIFETIKTKDNPIKDILKYIDSNYKKNLYLEVVAEMFNMNTKYFSYFFKKETGVGFNEYLTNLRMEEAKSLLKDTSLTINEVSDAVGYGNSATFIVAFKKYMGETPGNYRKSM